MRRAPVSTSAGRAAGPRWRSTSPLGLLAIAVGVGEVTDIDGTPVELIVLSVVAGGALMLRRVWPLAVLATTLTVAVAIAIIDADAVDSLEASGASVLVALYTTAALLELHMSLAALVTTVTFVTVLDASHLGPLGGSPDRRARRPGRRCRNGGILAARRGGRPRMTALLPSGYTERSPARGPDASNQRTQQPLVACANVTECRVAWDEIVRENAVSPLAYPILACWALLEVSLRVREGVHGKGKRKRDRGTRVSIAISLGVAIGVAAFAASRVPSLHLPVSLSGLGVLVMWLGLAMRVWAIAALGSDFRTTVEVDPGQAVVATGPYKWIRHPSYAGLLLILAGFGLALGNWLSLAACLALPLPALVRRIQVEEAELTRVLGDAYRTYRVETARLIPGLW
jgi:protein-S-isoprenylcysteine O-methyltransferase Ste14/anti-anti-sigma regulatory factor